MIDNSVSQARVDRLRQLMAEHGWDAVVLRNLPDLRWLTAAERVFDTELAHTAFISADEMLLHTDSRYFNTFVERLGTDGPWVLDMDAEDHAAWAAKHIARTHAHVVALEDSVNLGFFDNLEQALYHQSVAALLPRMHKDIALKLRAVKDAEECELMAHAQSITDAAFAHICEFIKPGMTELEIRRELEGYMFSHGADSLAFDSIVASGPNGANPHAQPSDRKVQEGDFIVIDFGAGYHDYHSDMTRTVCIGEPSEEQLKVYNTVREAHEKAAEMARAGVVGKDVHALAAKIISDAGYGEYFGHGLGHGVGVEIHEEPNFNMRNDKPVPEGAVITIEPGIYLPGKFGVRLEDFGIVTKDGYKSFTQSTHDLVIIPVD